MADEEIQDKGGDRNLDGSPRRVPYTPPDRDAMKAERKAAEDPSVHESDK